MGTKAIVLNHISKSYKDVKAVNDISLTVNKGETLGIIGANGAGKTTLLEMMMGIKEPSSGTIEILGLDAAANKPLLKRRIGIQLQQTSMYDRIKVKEALRLFRSYYENGRDLDEIVRLLGLKPYLNHYVRNLSGGWQQRTSLALALVGDPDIIFLDEPTTGLDPQARLELWNAIHDLKWEGKTILLSTHYMDEANKHCDRIAVIRQGKLIACDTPQRLIDTYTGGTGTLDDVYALAAIHTTKEAVSS